MFFVERKTEDTFVIKEIGLKEDRQKLVELIRKQGGIENTSAKIVFFNEEWANVKQINLTFKESSNHSHYLFSRRSNK